MEHDTMPVLGSGDVSEHPQGFAMWVCRFFWGGDLGFRDSGSRGRRPTTGIPRQCWKYSGFESLGLGRSEHKTRVP